MTFTAYKSDGKWFGMAKPSPSRAFTTIIGQRTKGRAVRLMRRKVARSPSYYVTRDASASPA